MTLPGYKPPQQMDAADHFLRTMLGFDEGTLDWHAKAACYSMIRSPETPNPFFSPVGDDDSPKSEPDRPQRIAKAKSICAECPVQVECVMWALRTEDRYSIAGGLTPTQRRKALSKWLDLKEDLWGEAADDVLRKLALDLLGR